MDEFLPLPSTLLARGFTQEVASRYTYLRPPLCPVPPGVFFMGTAPNRATPLEVDETPQHQVTLPAFHLGRYSVTVAEYACFVYAGYAEPRRWQHQLGKLDHPVVYVSWHDALAYAAWLRNRLTSCGVYEVRRSGKSCGLGSCHGPGCAIPGAIPSIGPGAIRGTGDAIAPRRWVPTRTEAT